MTGVAIYCRVSTDKQELDQQIEACKRFCEFKGLEVGALFSEIGSGKHFARPEFQAMLARVRKLEFSHIVVFRFDRLGRNAREAILLFEELEQKGIKVISINESLDTSTAIGRAMQSIIITLAQLERENISEATRQRLSALKRLGKRLGRPYRDFNETDAVRMRQDGKSYREIAIALKVPTSTVRRRLFEKSVSQTVGSIPTENLEESADSINVAVNEPPVDPGNGQNQPEVLTDMN